MSFKHWFWRNLERNMLVVACLLTISTVGFVWCVTVYDLRASPKQYKPIQLRERHLEWRLDRLEQKIDRLLPVEKP